MFTGTLFYPQAAKIDDSLNPSNYAGVSEIFGADSIKVSIIIHRSHGVDQVKCRINPIQCCLKSIFMEG